MFSAQPRAEDDQKVIAAIKNLRLAIETWAKRHDLWFDCGFKDYLSHVGGEPTNPPVVTMMWSEGPLRRVWDGDYGEGLDLEFSNLLDSLGYEYVNDDGVTISIYPQDSVHVALFFSYFHWQWVCSLIEQDFADVYHELYDHFAKRPDDLYSLHWRDYEILLSRIFQTQGFQVELGAGQGDGGVDIRLLQRDPLGDILTFVQAKKYAPKNKIDLQSVSSLVGISFAEGAQKSLFVTTSAYAPVARNFAERKAVNLDLATSEDVREWCKTASTGIITDKSKLVSPTNVMRLLEEVSQRPDARVVRAGSGYNMVLNDFALVVKETKHAALLMGLSSKTVSDDGYGQEGHEVPILDGTSLKLTAEGVWRAKRSVENGEVSYWDGRRLYYAWDKKPVFFSYVD